MAIDHLARSTSSSQKEKHNSLLDWLKPRRAVAIARLKNNGFAMVVLLLVTQLAPIIPSPIACLWMLFAGRKGMGSMTQLLCWMELALFAVLFANIIQSYAGLRYPPPPCDPISTPVKRALVQSSPAPRPLKGFTPNFSQMNSSLASSHASPVSTPTRILNYKTPLSSSSPSSSPLNTSLNSPFSATLMSSPLGYRSRQSHTQPVRSMRASLLNQFEADDDDEL